MISISIPNELARRKALALNRLARINHIRACRIAVEQLGATEWAILPCGDSRPHKAFRNKAGAWIARDGNYFQPDMSLWPNTQWHGIKAQ